VTYQVNSISAITDVPALVGTFAALIGWETDLTTPTQPILRRPQGGDSNSGSNSAFEASDAIPFQVTASVAGSTHTLTCAAYQYDSESNSAVTALQAGSAVFASPVVGAGSPAVVLPTQVHLIGALTPEPYIAIIVEYGSNLYRHMYIGNMEKVGDYQGGECISATDGPGSSSSTRVYYDLDMKYLFSGRQSRRAAAESGGVHVDHADNAYPWRFFVGSTATSSTPLLSFPVNGVIGGYNDAVNDGYLARGRSPFASLNTLSPINLYNADPIVGDVEFRPIGRPAGVRHVHMQDLQPGAEIIVGGMLWRVFPSHARRSEVTMPESTGVGSNPPEFETSLWVGYAYAVGEEDSNSAGA